MGSAARVRGALELLLEKGVPHAVRYYLLEPLSREEIKKLLTKLGILAAELVRENEILYKEKYEGKNLGEEEWLEALFENPILIERPIVEKGDRAIIARPPEKVLEML